jgi:predicted nucleotidyltransferase
MASLIQRLAARGLLRPPAFLPDNMLYETRLGSAAYGASTNSSDFDICGFAMPPRDHLFPNLAGEIAGFGRPRPRFEVFQEHHVRDPDALGGKGCEYDFAIYSLPRYFTLCLEGNPNMVDSLFTSQEFVLHQTRVGNMVRERRRLFLHKGIWSKFKGYAYAQLHKMQSRQPVGKRREVVEQFGFDVKYAYHVVRLLYEGEQLLMHGDMDLRRDAEHLKAIRRGDVSVEAIRQWAAEKESQLEKLYLASPLPEQPDEPAVRRLLLECIEEHYGCLDQVLARPDASTDALRQIEDVIDRWRKVRSSVPAAEVSPSQNGD